MKKKLLCINNGYPSKKYPKYTSYIQTIVNCLKQANFEVDVFAIRFNGKITPFYKFVKHIQFWIKALFINLNNYNIVYINHLPFVWPILFNHTLNKENVYIHWHGNDLVSNTYFIKCALKLIRKKGKGFKHITPSQYFKRKLIEIMGYNENIVFVSPSGGVNTLLFRPIQNLKIDEIVIGYSAALMKSKGADTFLEIVRKKTEIESRCDKRISFKLINYGPEAEFYVNRFKDIESNIKIIEKIPKEKMPEFYQSINILIMPSIRMGESLGLVVLEAMSCGIPVVTHNLCAFPEFVVPEESGELVDYCEDLNERSDRFINALVKIIDNYQSYHPVNIVLSSYSEESVIQSYKTILKD